MENISFVKTPCEINQFYKILNSSTLGGQEGLFLAWQTDPEILKKVVPWPLEPTGPYVMAYVSYIFESGFWKDYNEGALLVPVKYKDQNFAYFLSMQIAGKNDIPIFLGREYDGFPKKNADELCLYRSGDKIKVSIKRNEIRFFEAEAEIGNYNHPDADMIFSDFQTGGTAVGNNLNFKYGLDLCGDTVQFTGVRLASQQTTTTYRSAEKAKITKIKLVPSQDDPWAELKVLQPLGAVYYKADSVMGPPITVVRLDAEEYAPYLFSRWDSSMLGDAYRYFKISE